MNRQTTGEEALPEGWREVRLGDVCQVVRGGSPRPIGNYLTQDVSGLNWLRIGDIQPDRKYVLKTKEKIKSEGLRKSVLVQEGDFILSNSMSYGRPYIMKIKTCIHDGWLALKNIEKSINKEFLYYSLLSEKTQNKFHSISAGSGVKNLKKESVSLVTIKIPPLEEQKSIATLLGTWDTAIEKTEALIAAKEKQFKWLLKRLISDQQDNPEWRKVKLGNLFGTKLTIKKGKMLTKEQMNKGNFPVIAGGQTYATFHNEFTHGTKSITVSSSGAYAGFIWFHDYPIFATDCNVITTTTEIIEYFYYAIKMQQKRLYSMQSGGAQPHIYSKDIAIFDVAVPPVIQQQEIANTLNLAQHEINLLKQLTEYYRAQKRGMMQRLLTGKQRIEP